MNELVTENIDKIVELLREAKSHDGIKMSPNADTRLNEIRGLLVEMTDGEVDFYPEKTTTNMRIGMYKITLKCSKEVEDYIYEQLQQEL